MSNKAIGTAFEKEVAKILFDNGFWAMNIQDDKNGQPFDVIAGKENIIYAFECKVCDNGRFDVGRIEVNQKYAMETFRIAGNMNRYFVFKYRNNIFIKAAAFVLNATESFKVDEVCINFERWLESCKQ